ncbi:MAG: MBOAT family protein [Betaproteobacteria bacterium]|nr:MBOAT family protein [Betaproteobacteria bacterium]
MLFNSPVFLIFAALFFAGWPLAKRHVQIRYFYIVLFSFVFYGWWDWRFLFLIIGSGLIDYLAGLGMVRYRSRRKLLLVLSLVGNIGSLMVFKYSGFFADNLTWLFAQVGIQVALRESIPHFVLILPVGISFYTFQSMSYSIDVYKRELQPTSNILQFFAFLAFFPQLVAGPIVRAADLLPQLKLEPHTDEAMRWEGAKLIAHGFAKKVFIADNLAYYVTGAFNDPVHSPSSWYWWLIMTAFAFQIYCDFSGYSDIARGLAKWAGYDFLVNFRHPYVATSLRDFWSRWHISLSTWFRDYVYIPLGGSRGSRLRSECNMWTTMLVSGFWHGAAWNFLIWGGLHAVGMSVERFTRWPQKLMSLPGGRHLAALVLLLEVWVTWVFFRATSLEQAVRIVGSMFSFHGGPQMVVEQLGGVKLLNIGIIIVIAALREYWFFLHLDERRFLPRPLERPVQVVALAAIVVVCVFFRGPGSQFIYFQF